MHYLIKFIQLTETQYPLIILMYAITQKKKKKHSTLKTRNQSRTLRKLKIFIKKKNIFFQYIVVYINHRLKYDIALPEQF